MLAEGDPVAAWKESQLQLIEQQLADSTVKGLLRLELESQKKWLSRWARGKLGNQPWPEQNQVDQLLVEPAIDPDGRAVALRKRLLAPKARPTSKDTDELERKLAEFPEDLGFKQLYLHWIDQKQYRESHVRKVVEVAQDLALRLQALQPQTEETRVARAFCYYRAARAMIHQESPEFQRMQPLGDAKKHEEVLVALYSQLVELVGRDRPEFILVEIRMLRRDHWNGQALVKLEENAWRLDPKWCLRQRVSLLSDLGWAVPAKEAETVAAAADKSLER